MVPWVDLPQDVLQLIVNQLHCVSLVSMRGVCRSWREALHCLPVSLDLPSGLIVFTSSEHLLKSFPGPDIATCFGNVTSLRFLGGVEKVASCRPADFRALVEALPRLECLKIPVNCRVPAIELGSLAMLTRLRKLSLRQVTLNTMTAPNLAGLVQLRGLAALDLRDMQLVSAAGLAALSALTGLRELHMCGPCDVPGVPFRDRKRMTESRDALLLAKLAPTFASLQTLFLHDWALTDKAVAGLARLQRVEVLGLASMRAVSSAGLQLLAGLPRLRRMVLQGIPQWRVPSMPILARLPGANVLGHEDEFDVDELW